MNIAKRQMKIATLLSYGKENAIYQKELEALTGCDGRTLRKAIEAERRSGIPILSSPAHGYYLPGNELETAEFVRSMRQRAREIALTAAAVEAATGGGNE